MLRVLIIEGNSPAMLASGSTPAAAPFMRTLAALATDVTLRFCAPYERMLALTELDGVDGVIFTGSGVAWATDAAEAAPLRDAMETVFAAGLPTWGSCNGLQLAAVVLGGRVGASPNGLEAGLARAIQISQPHPMLAGRAPGFAAPCIHRDEVTRPPEGAEVIGSNAHSRVQAMVYERHGVTFWGTQYHPECAPSDIAGYLEAGGIFAEHAPLIDALHGLDAAPETAEILGARPGDLAMPQRASELAAWVAMVRARTTQRRGSLTITARA